MTYLPTSRNLIVLVAMRTLQAAHPAMNGRTLHYLAVRQTQGL